jgi:hypothetical protein
VWNGVYNGNLYEGSGRKRDLFLGLVVMVLQVTGRVLVNLGPPVEQRKTNHSLVHVRNQKEKVTKFIRDPRSRNYGM